MPLSASSMEVITALGLILVSIIAARFFVYILSNYFSRLASRTKTTIDDSLIVAGKKPLYYLIILLGTEFALGQITAQPELILYIDSGIFVGKIILISVFIHRIISISVEWYSKVIAPKTQTQFDDEFLPLFKRITAFFVYGVAIVVILDYFSYNITAIVASLGIAGIALALAAQDTLANMISGFVIMADRPFRIKDIIELPNGEYGEVYEIGLRSTKILTLDAMMVVIPNSKIGDSQIVNYSYPDPRLRLKVPIGVAYGTDIDSVTNVLLDIAKKQPNVLVKPPSRVTLDSFGDFSINLILYVWINSHKDKIEVINRINRDIDKRFKEEGIEIPFPIRTIHLKDRK